MIRLSLHPTRQREPLGLPLAQPHRPPMQAGGEAAEARERTDWPLGRPILPASRRGAGPSGW